MLHDVALHHLPNSIRICCKSWNKPFWAGIGLSSNYHLATCPLAAFLFRFSPPKQVKVVAPAQMLLCIICQNCNRIHCKSWNKPSWTGAGLSSNHLQATCPLTAPLSKKFTTETGKNCCSSTNVALHHLPNCNRIHCKSWYKLFWIGAGMTSNYLQATCPLAAPLFRIFTTETGKKSCSSTNVALHLRQNCNWRIY